MFRTLFYIFLLPIYLFAQGDNTVKKDVLLVDYTYYIKMKGLPTATIVNSYLSADQNSALYEIDFLNNHSFVDQENSKTGLVLSIKPTENDFIFKDNIKKEIFSIQNIEMKPFLVKDSMSIFNWTMETEFKNILGYKCQKATILYRGRNYVAFFTTDIPFHTGPWKFCNLPGLILEVKSIDNVFKITANKLQIKNEKIKIKNTYINQLEKSISWNDFILEYKKKYDELLHYRGLGGVTKSIPKKGIETYID